MCCTIQGLVGHQPYVLTNITWGMYDLNLKKQQQHGQVKVGKSLALVGIKALPQVQTSRSEVLGRVLDDLRLLESQLSNTDGHEGRYNFLF